MAWMELITEGAAVILQALQQKSSHVPFRNSKLTRLLEDSVGFNSRTMVILTCRFVKMLSSQQIPSHKIMSICIMACSMRCSILQHWEVQVDFTLPF